MFLVIAWRRKIIYSLDPELSFVSLKICLTKMNNLPSLVWTTAARCSKFVWFTSHGNKLWYTVQRIHFLTSKFSGKQSLYFINVYKTSENCTDRLESDKKIYCFIVKTFFHFSCKFTDSIFLSVLKQATCLIFNQSLRCPQALKKMRLSLLDVLHNL